MGNLGVTNSGQPTLVTFTADRHVGILRQIDSKLNDVQFVNRLFKGADPSEPKRACGAIAFAFVYKCEAVRKSG